MSTEEVITEEQKQQAEQPPLSREQRRYKERIEADAKKTYEQFTGKFFEFFIHYDNPDSVEVQEKAKHMNAQWKMYCKKMRLVDAAFVMFEDNFKTVLSDYYTLKSDSLKQ